jgi:hypothetical protein
MSDRRAIVLVFAAALALCVLVTKSHVLSWNDGSRFATVDALTAAHTFAIDGSPYARDLGDKIRFGGHFYSDKPPLLALLGTGVALALAPLGVTLRATPGTAVYLITLLTVGVWFGIGCAYAYAFQRLLGATRRTAFAVAALTGTATLALTYAIVFANHVPAGAAALAGCYHAVRARGGAAVHAALAGFFFALAYAFDASTIIFVVAALVLLWDAPLRTFALAVAAALPILAAQLAYNVAISGSVLPTAFNAEVWSDPSLPMHTWAPRIWQVYTPAQYAAFIVSLLVGSRGLLLYTPLVAIAGHGFLFLARSRGQGARIALAVTATTVIYFFAIVFLQNDAEAAHFGERRFVDLFFVIGIGLGPALTALRVGLGRAIVRVAAALSIAIAALGTTAPFAGTPGESGLVFASAEFAALARRAPIQAVLDIILVVVVIALVDKIVIGAQTPDPA